MGALEFIVAYKTPHPATECFLQGGETIVGVMLLKLI
jgi:hypothetical protein